MKTKKREMLGIDRESDRRSYTILAQFFSHHTPAQHQKQGGAGLWAHFLERRSPEGECGGPIPSPGTCGRRSSGTWLAKPWAGSKRDELDNLPTKAYPEVELSRIMPAWKRNVLGMLWGLPAVWKMPP
jgi:hypothetical protein